MSRRGSVSASRQLRGHKGRNKKKGNNGNSIYSMNKSLASSNASKNEQLKDKMMMK